MGIEHKKVIIEKITRHQGDVQWIVMINQDFLMQELLKLKLSLRHELNRVTQIIDHLNPD